MAFGRTFLYHKTCPDGKIFDQEDDCLDHLKAGWVDSPGKIDDSFPLETSPEPIQEVEVEKKQEFIKAPPKKPGRPPKKIKGGK